MPLKTDRYQKQINLAKIGVENQKKIEQTHVLIVGLGGLGSPASMYLASSGVGHMTLADFDVIESSNLQRQILYTEEDVGKLKTDIARQRIKNISSAASIKTLDFVMEESDFLKHVDKADVVLDCCDNAETRYALNRVAHKLKKPLISAAAIQWEGQITTFDFNNNHSPCYECLQPQTKYSKDIPSCSSIGVIAPVVGALGTMQALECIHTILGEPQLVGKVMLLDGRKSNWHTVTLAKRINCPVCQKTKIDNHQS